MGLCVKKNKSQYMGVLGRPVARGIVRDASAGEAGKGFCRNYEYCLPCSERILIPDIFRFESYYDRYDLKEWARQQYQSLSVNASACSKCEHCIELCPYGVPILEKLKTAHQTLQ